MAGPLEELAREEGSGSAGAPAFRYTLLDVFAERPLEGNQLAVFADAGPIEPTTMQALARELRLSESVFLSAPREGADARVRIFTPATELPFAGHPVLGAGALLARALGQTSAVLETGAGPVAVELQADGVAAAMTQPIPVWEPVAEPGRLLAALGIESAELPVERYSNGPSHFLVDGGSPGQVAALDPDLHAVQAFAGAATVSCFAGEDGAFKTRVFAPGLGVPEDPATGSAAGPLAAHLVRHGRAAPGQQLEIRQGAELGRPSLLLARADGEGEHFTRVEVGGGVLTVGRGELRPD